VHKLTIFLLPARALGPAS